MSGSEWLSSHLENMLLCTSDGRRSWQYSNHRSYLKPPTLLMPPETVEASGTRSMSAIPFRLLFLLAGISEYCPLKV